MDKLIKRPIVKASSKWVTTYLAPEKHCPSDKILRSYCDNRGALNKETGLVTCDFSRDKIALVTFNEPLKLNALSVPMGAAFKSTIDDLSSKNDLRAVILTGKGIIKCIINVL